MKAFKLGRRSAPFARYALLLFDDRVEEVSYTLTGLEVKRFFFDEADFMTVHRLSSLGVVALSGLLSVLLVVLAIEVSDESIAAWIFGVPAALMLGLAVFLFSSPPYKLVLAAPFPETVECVLSRRRGRREEAIGRLTRAIVRHQSRTARATAPARVGTSSSVPPAS